MCVSSVRTLSSRRCTSYSTVADPSLRARSTAAASRSVSAPSTRCHVLSPMSSSAS